MLAANPGAMALYAGLGDWPVAQRNIGRFLFLHPAARDIYADWDYQIRGCVARLRALAGTDPDAPDLAALIGEHCSRARSSPGCGNVTTSPAAPPARHDRPRRTRAPHRAGSRNSLGQWTQP